MLDAGANNAFILMQKSGHRDSRIQFLNQLCLDLAKPAIQARFSDPAQKHSEKDAANQMKFCVN